MTLRTGTTIARKRTCSSTCVTIAIYPGWGGRMPVSVGCVCVCVCVCNGASEQRREREIETERLIDSEIDRKSDR